MQVRLRGRLAALVERLDHDEDTTGGLLHVLEDMHMLHPVVDRVRVFALGPCELTRDGDGLVVHADIRAGDGELWLHQESAEFGLASPKNLEGHLWSFMKPLARGTDTKGTAP